MINQQKIALVLSGGGARGIAHIGVIEVLEEQGYKISSIAGTSMGALVGGIYGLGKLVEFKEWLFTLDKMKVFHLIDFSFGNMGLIKGDRLLNTMKTFIEDMNIEDMPIPYSATACDIENRKEVVFTSGSAYDAIRASISIPSVFTPIKTKQGLLVDGGVLNNIPISNITRTENDRLIAVNVNSDIPLDKIVLSTTESEKQEKIYQKRLESFQNHIKKINPLNKTEHMGYFDVLNNTINLMVDKTAQLNLERHKPDLLINVSRASASTFDFFKAEELVEYGRRAAIQRLKDF